MAPSCDKGIPILVMSRLNKTVIRPVLTYGSKRCPMKKDGELILERAEMKMLRRIRIQ